MSSLIFATEQTRAFIATDTLGVNPTDGTPLVFTTKAFYVPHLNMMIAGTGLGDFMNGWFFLLNTRMRRRCIEDLNEVAQAQLLSPWRIQQKALRQDGVKPITTTIYHFGFSEDRSRLLTFAYRSANDFEPEQLPYGTAVKPQGTLSPSLNVQDLIDDPLTLRHLMDDQRRVQREMPKDQRLYIGGEIYCHYLTEGCYSVFYTHRFDDFEEDAKIIYGTRP